MLVRKAASLPLMSKGLGIAPIHGVPAARLPGAACRVGRSTKVLLMEESKEGGVRARTGPNRQVGLSGLRSVGLLT